MSRLRWAVYAALVLVAVSLAALRERPAPRGAAEAPVAASSALPAAPSPLPAGELPGGPHSSPAGPEAVGSHSSLPEEAVAEADLGPAAALYRSAAEAYRAGDLERAAAGLREAVALAPGQPVIESGLTIALEALGHRRLAAGDFAGAEAVLAEVLSRDRERGGSWTALGYAQLRQKRPADAKRSLEEAVRLRPDDAQAHLLLGHARYDTGDTAGALAALTAGRAAGADDARYRALVARLEREVKAEAGYRTAESAHFAVSFEGGGTSEQAGYLVSLLLEDAYHAVGRRLEYYPTEAVHAVLYPRETFRDVTRSPDWAGAVFDGKIRLPIGGLTDRTEALQRTVAHEYTHALVYRLAGGRAPVWLNEGLAQLSEGAASQGARERFRAYVREGGRVAGLRQLEGSFTGLGAAEAELAYLHALAATDFLVTRYGQTATRRILDRLGMGMPLSTAVEDALYVSYDELERQWVASYR